MLWAMALPTFRIESAPGIARITVNGEPVEGARAYRVEQGKDELALLTVMVGSLEGVVEGEGIVHVQAEGGQGARAAVLEWLELLDPEAIERQALDRQGWGSGGLGAEMLEVLKELAQGLPE